MARLTKTSARLAVAVATAAGLAVTGMPGAAQATPARASASGVPQLRVAITDNDLYLDGPTTFAAGRLKMSLEGARDKGSASAAVARLDPGYTWHHLRSDIRTFGENLFGPNGNKKKGLKALNDVIDHVTAYGGFVADAGKAEHGRLLIDQGAGTYYLFDDSHNLPRHPHRLTVTAPAGPQALPTTDGKVVAHTNRRFRGSTVLPANGNITFKNVSTESPHFLGLVHVKNGTTRKQVINAFQNNDHSIFLPGEQDMELLTTGQQMEVHLHLQPGQYAEACFFPDPKTGMPHALMGMVRIVRVK